MAITRLKLERFTAFESLDVGFSPNVNIFLGTNGTGKTHLMKVVYAACDVTKSDLGFVEDCAVFNLKTWNSKLPQYQIRRVQS